MCLIVIITAVGEIRFIIGINVLGVLSSKSVFLRSNSFYSRYFSWIFHITVFVVSISLCAFLIILNFALISSVQILGSSMAAPELDRLCVSVLPLSHTVRAAVLPEPFFSTTPLAEIVNR